MTIEIKAGDQFRSSWGLEATVIGIREVTGKRNLIVMWVDKVTNQRAYQFMSATELNKTFKYRITNV